MSSLIPDVVGPALAIEDPGYADAVRGFNLAVVHEPNRVLTVRSTAEVAAAMAYAAREGLSVSVKTTGHGWTEPVTSGLMLDTSGIQGLSIDPETRTATVGAGVRWHQVVEAAAPHGLAPLNGSSLTVGVVGYTLGGGMGPMARTFGFAADHVIRFDVVTPDGSVHAVDRAREPELFWGLCGGRPEAGVVTEITFALMPVPRFYGGAIFFAGTGARTVLRAWRDWSRTLPDAMSTSIALLRLPDIPQIPDPIRGRLSVHLRCVYVGAPEDGAALLAPMRACAPALLDDVVDRPYAEIAAVHMDPVDPLPCWDRGTLLADLPDEALDALVATAGPGLEIPLILAELRLMGGAVAVGAPGTEPDNAIDGRDAAYSAYVVGPLPPELAKVTPQVGSAVIEALGPWATGSTLLNLQGSGCPASARDSAWSGESRARLAALSDRFDPARRMWRNLQKGTPS